MSMLQNGFVPEGEEKAYAFGIQTGVETIIGWASTLLVGYLFGMFWESALFLVAYSLVRTYAGGYHAETFIQCFISSCFLVAAVMCFCRWVPHVYLSIGNALLLITSAPVIWSFAPVAAKHKPLDEEETECFRRKCRVRLAIECAAVLALALFGQLRFAMVISTGLFVLASLMLCGIWQKRPDAK